MTTIVVHVPKQNKFKLPARIRHMTHRRQKIACLRWVKDGLNAAMLAVFDGRTLAPQSEVLNAAQVYLDSITNYVTFTVDIQP